MKKNVRLRRANLNLEANSFRKELKCDFCFVRIFSLVVIRQTGKSVKQQIRPALKVCLFPQTLSKREGLLGRNIFFFLKRRFNEFQNKRKSCSMTKPTKWSVHPVKTQIRLGIRTVWLRVFAVHMKKPWDLSYPMSSQQRFWSDWASYHKQLNVQNVFNLEFCNNIEK